MKKLVFFMLAVTFFSADLSLACGSHGGCGGYGYGVGPRPLIVGGGAVAFRRSRRLARRSARAAYFGFFGRSARLQARSYAAFNRGMFRNARFNGF